MKRRRFKTCLYMINLIFFVVTSMVILHIGEVSSQVTPNVFVDPEISVADPSEYFTININISDVTGLHAWDLEVEYDREILYTNETMIKEGPFLNSTGPTDWWAEKIGNGIDYLYASCWRLDGGNVSGSGTLANTTFQVLAKGKSDLNLNVWLYYANWTEISHTKEGGIFYTKSPKAIFTYKILGETIQFNASESYDYDGYIVSYTWNFSDGTVETITENVTTHAFPAGGTYNVTLTVTDNETLTDTTWQEITLARMYVDPPSQVVEQGETIIVDIKVADVANVSSWEFRMTWDPRILYTNKTLVREGPFLRDVVDNTQFVVAQEPAEPAEPRKLTVGCMFLEQALASGSGTLANITFFVKSDAKGKTALDLYETHFYDDDVNDIAHAAEDGEVATKYPVPSFIIEYEDRVKRNPVVNQRITFNATASYDPNGNIVSYQWNFGDGNITDVNYPVTTHTYTENDTYKVSLTVQDSEGLTETVNETARGRKTINVDIYDIAIINVEPKVTIASPGAKINIDVTVANLGDTLATNLNVTLYYLNTTTRENTSIPYQYSPDLIPKVNMTMNPGDQEVIKFVWNTTNVAFGDYTLWANTTLTYWNNFVPEWENFPGDNIFINGNVTLGPGIPVAEFSFSPIPPLVNKEVVFNASMSYDTSYMNITGHIISYNWDFGDDTKLNTTEPITTHTFQEVGDYTVTLTVVDNESHTGVSQQILEVLMHEIAIINATLSADWVEPNGILNITVIFHNYGNFSETFNLTAYYDENLIKTQSYINFAAERTSQYTFEWNTTGVANGSYVIKAVIPPVQDEANTTNNTWIIGTVGIGQQSCSISINLSADTITIGDSVEINGSLTPSLVGVNITLSYSLNEGDWVNIATVETNSNGEYSYTWTPSEVGTYKIKSSWAGDERTHAAQSEEKTLTVQASEGPNLLVYGAIVVAVVVVVAIALYFMRFRARKNLK